MKEEHATERAREVVGEQGSAALSSTAATGIIRSFATEQQSGSRRPKESLMSRGGAPILFSFSYVTAFSAGFIYGGNREFALYTLVAIAVIALVAYVLTRVDIPSPLLWGLSVMGLLHMAGGGLHIDGGRLYGYQIIDVYNGSAPGMLVFKYDQLVHFLGYAMLAIIIHYLLRRTAPQMNALGRAVLSGIAAMGAGSLNELAEFTAVLMLPSTGVGDYFNSMLDLFFNTAGAILGVFAFESWLRLKKMR